MQRGMLELCLIIVVVIGIHAERILHNGSVVGSISPAKPVSSIIAVQGKDSVKVLSAIMAILVWNFNPATGN